MTKEDINLMLQVIEMWLDQFRIEENEAVQEVLRLREKLWKVKSIYES